MNPKDFSVYGESKFLKTNFNSFSDIYIAELL